MATKHAFPLLCGLTVILMSFSNVSSNATTAATTTQKPGGQKCWLLQGEAMKYRERLCEHKDVDTISSKLCEQAVLLFTYMCEFYDVSWLRKQVALWKSQLDQAPQEFEVKKCDQFKKVQEFQAIVGMDKLQAILGVECKNYCEKYAKVCHIFSAFLTSAKANPLIYLSPNCIFPAANMTDVLKKYCNRESSELLVTKSCERIVHLSKKICVQDSQNELKELMQSEENALNTCHADENFCDRIVMTVSNTASVSDQQKNVMITECQFHCKKTLENRLNPCCWLNYTVNLASAITATPPAPKTTSKTTPTPPPVQTTAPTQTEAPANHNQGEVHTVAATPPAPKTTSKTTPTPPPVQTTALTQTEAPANHDQGDVHTVVDFSCETEADCTHGECKKTKCVCEAGYTGDKCESFSCKTEADCTHGECKKTKCVCEAGYTGDKCEIEENDKNKVVKPTSSWSNHFMAYFLTVCVLCIAGYVLFHNKKKIVAFIVEGRNGKGRPRTSDYKPVKTNVEEAMPSMDKSVTTKNYIY